MQSTLVFPTSPRADQHQNTALNPAEKCSTTQTIQRVSNRARGGNLYRMGTRSRSRSD
jgi:hypothetical protein